MRWVFNLGYLIVAAVAWPWFVYKYATTGKYRAGIGQRLGRLPQRADARPSIWVHAVSVGELLQIRPLLKALRQRHPGHDVVVTYTTKTAAEIAARELGDYYHCYSPLDLSWVVARFFRVLNPALIVLVELELWPNWLTHARCAGVPVLLANGRISAGSFANYRRFGWLLRPAYQAIRVWAMQDDVYAERARVLAGIGGRESGIGNRESRIGKRESGIGNRESKAADPTANGQRSMPNPQSPIPNPGTPIPYRDTPTVVSTGNLKYDALRAEADPAQSEYFRRAFAIAPGQRVVIFGSTHPGEHEAIVAMLPRLEARAVIVPRHPERHQSVRDLLARAGLAWRNRSELSPESPASPRDVILLDTVGELAAVYAIADVVFVGGSLIPHGGQNMAEPVALGKATLFGPHTANFRATVRELKECSGAIEVPDAITLETEVKRLFNDPQARDALGKSGQTRLLAGRGALERHLQLIAELLHEGQADHAAQANGSN